MITAAKTNSTHGQMLAKADHELATLAKAEADLHAQLRALDEESETIQAERHQRGTQGPQLRATAAQLHATALALAAQERLAKGTAADGKVSDQARVAEQESANALHELEAFESKNAGVEEAWQQRLHTLGGERVPLTRRLSVLASERQAIEQARDAISQAAGQDEYDDIVAGLEKLRKQVDARETALFNAETDLADFTADVLPRLADWPAYAAKIKSQLPPYEDASTRLLGAYLAFLDAIEKEGPSAKELLVANSLAWQIEIHAEFINSVIRREYNAIKQIANRRQATLKLLQLYRGDVK